MTIKTWLGCLLALIAMQSSTIVRAQSRDTPAAGTASPQTLSPAVQRIASEAANGDAEAQYKLAQLYNAGNGVPRDPAAAALWLRKAAGQDHAGAQASLGTSYLLGDGVPRSTENAIQWLTRSARQGNALAQTNLGAIYLNGDGAPQNFVLALAWMEKAAAQGQPLAQYSLGKMYQHGYGVRADNTIATQWYGKAAAQNYAPAAQELATLARSPGSAAAADASPLARAQNSAGVAATAIEAASARDAVLAAVQAWADAWSRKDVAAYLAHYADDFRTPGGASRDEWAALRRARIEGRRRIAVTVSRPRIEMNGDTATVSFLQKYDADTISETVMKTLVLTRRLQTWQILEETSGKAMAKR